MKYFTKKRFQELNSDEPSRMVAAARDWDKATERYRTHLQAIESRLPPSARKFAKKCCFHDAQLLTFSTGGEDEFAIMLRDGNRLYLLSYQLADAPTLGPAAESTAFSPQAVLWLYDEFDVTKANGAIQRVLFSDGSELAIPFTQIGVAEFEVHSPRQQRGNGKRSHWKSRSRTAGASRHELANLSVLNHLKPLHPIAVFNYG